MIEIVVRKIKLMKILRTLILFVFFVIIVADTIMILKLTYDKDDQIVQDTAKIKDKKNISQTKTEADSIKSQAVQAVKNNDDEKANTLLKQAQAKYKTINDNEGVADTDSQLYLLNNHTDPKTKDIITISAGQ